MPFSRERSNLGSSGEKFGLNLSSDGSNREPPRPAGRPSALDKSAPPCLPSREDTPLAALARSQHADPNNASVLSGLSGLVSEPTLPDLPDPDREIDTHAYDGRGRCVRHPAVRLRKRKLFGKGWKVLMSGKNTSMVFVGRGCTHIMSIFFIKRTACPDCCTEELRRIRYITQLRRREERDARASARQERWRRQQQEAFAGSDEAVRDGDGPSIDSPAPPRDYVTPVPSHEVAAAPSPSRTTRPRAEPSPRSPRGSLDPPLDISPRAGPPSRVAGVPPYSGPSPSNNKKTPPPSYTPPPRRPYCPSAAPIKSLPSDGSSRSLASRGTLSTASLSTRESSGSHLTGGGAAASGAGSAGRGPGYAAILAPHPEQETVPGPRARPGEDAGRGGRGPAGRGTEQADPAGGGEAARSRSLPRLKSMASGMLSDHVGRSISFTERQGGKGSTKSPSRPSARSRSKSRDVVKSGSGGSRSTSRGRRPGGQGRGVERRRDPSGERSFAGRFPGLSGAVAASCPNAVYC